MTRTTKLGFITLFFAALFLPAAKAQLVSVGDGGPGPVKAEHLTAELTALSPNIAPGKTLQIGLVLTLEEHWHVYWINAGGPGYPPAINWTLPKGLTASELHFTAPEQLPLGPLMDYGYEDQAVFPITLTASPSLKPGKIHLDAKVSWLVCNTQCFPGKAHLGLDLNVVAGPVPDPPLVGALGQAIKNLPPPLPERMSATATGGAKTILLTLHTGDAEQEAEIYPYDQDLIDPAAPQPIQATSDGIRVWLQRDAASTSLPKTLHLLVKFTDTEAYELTVPVTPGEPPAAASGKAAASGSSSSTDVTLFGALGLAFLGGIILNLMPCVFPVLFLKGLALVNSGNQEKSRQRLQGLVYTLGILVSFWILVAALLILRGTGHQLGWGFQLQSPGFIAILASLLFFLGLSMAGQFEIGLSLTSAGNDLANKQGLAGSFFTGVLATVVATPCTAPLMGAAIGFALAQPAWMTFLVFTALGLGLALPYLLLAMQPQWTRILPRPGAWMETLKQFTSLFLFGSAIWLTWVYGQLHGKDGVDRIVPLLCCYLILAIAGWTLSKWPGQWKSAIAAILLILFAIALPLRKITVETVHWDPWTPASFAAARASGQPIFIDFTAAWCLSCQVNERAVLNSADIDTRLVANHFILLKADWTQYDPAITNQLSTLNRSGVPTYVIYPPGPNSNPDVLPELLTKDAVSKAIDKDTKSPANNFTCRRHFLNLSSRAQRRTSVFCRDQRRPRHLDRSVTPLFL